MLKYRTPEEKKEADLARARRYKEAHYEELREKQRLYREKLRAANGAAVNAEIRAWRLANPEAAHAIERRKHLKRTYDLSMEEYEAMHTAQGGVCAICGQPEVAVIKGRRARLAVDHPKGTKLRRALLCRMHNQGIGMFNHDPRLLRAAADYLEKYNAEALQLAQHQG